MVLIPIVDEQDNLLCHKERDMVWPGDIYRISDLRIRNSKGQHLIAQRALCKKNHPGYRSGAVCGTVEKGESYESNIRKEMFEEIGLPRDYPLELGPMYLGKSEGWRKHWSQRFLTTVDWDIADFCPAEDEVEKLLRVSSQELKKMISVWEMKFCSDILRCVGQFCL